MSTIETSPQLPVSTADVEVNAPASGQANGAQVPTSDVESALEGFDRWIKDFQKYEAVLVRFPMESSSSQLTHPTE